MKPTAQAAPGWPQSLYSGAAGITLLHAVKERVGAGDTEAMRACAESMFRVPIMAGPEGFGLYEGVPAVAYVLTFTDTPSTERLLSVLDGHVRRITTSRLEGARARLESGQTTKSAEFDLIGGLAGLGVYHLRRGNAAELQGILSYLVQLSEPITVCGQTLPGWWSVSEAGTAWPADGHGNFGLAHGITGPLALLATSVLCGYTVAGQERAITRICQWLDDWRTGNRRSAHWPEWIDLQEQRRGSTARTGPRRPSWCYGTPGIARALQLAGRALGDTTLQERAEQALAGCLLDPQQLALLTDASLCHGWAGLVQATRRAAEDEKDGQLSELLPRLRAGLATHLEAHGPPVQPTLMEGTAGLDLAQLDDSKCATPETRWDLCLLLSG
ncbi:lanthionine synthetase C family protein [Streptomyces sp. H51]|uniref:lanthionine synthetase C family protein n=1 Tax=Streptomyces sp. H51 TaxID=3111770 RepID=UPI002D768877|nr:lanthionine synthetase C family protein [Streptomyces sp. H51]